MAKRDNQIGLRVNLNTADRRVEFSFYDKATDRAVADYTVEADDFPKDMQLLHQLYGVSKIGQDRTSQDAGKSPAERIAAMQEVYANQREGNWASERKSGGPTISFEVLALAELEGIPANKMQELLRQRTPEVRAQIFAHKSVVEKVAELKAAAASAAGSLDRYVG